jgi:hypothetical protein
MSTAITPWAEIKRKNFFSEEKKQKTFMSLSPIYPAAYAQETRVFWFFFQKKNGFLAFGYVIPEAAFITSAACPGTFTLCHAFTTRPSAPTRNVARSIPMYLRPYMDFSTHTP